MQLTESHCKPPEATTAPPTLGGSQRGGQGLLRSGQLVARHVHGGAVVERARPQAQLDQQLVVGAAEGPAGGQEAAGQRRGSCRIPLSWVL